MWSGFGLVAPSSAPGGSVGLADGAADAPHPLLTTLPQFVPGATEELDASQLDGLLADSRRCEQLMRRHGIIGVRAGKTAAEPAFIAAALALLCGWFTKQNGNLNPSAAARACG